MKKLLLIIFSVLLCFALASCGAASNSDNPQNDSTENKDNDNSPENEVISTLTDTSEKREYVVNYIRDIANIKWTPEKTFILYGKYQAWSYNLTYEKGKTYYGLPFLVDSRGTKQEFLNSVVDGVYVGPTTGSNCIGDACYDAVYVTLIQVCPSITFKSTEDMLPKNETGLKAVGEWNWEASKHDTPTIMSKNSLEVMTKAYAQLEPGDVVLKHVVAQDAGHTRIISEKPVIVYKDGAIDPNNSYITTIEQTNVWDKTAYVNTTWYVDHTYTFAQLYKSYFVPLTPIDYTQNTGDAYISAEDLLTAENTTEAKKLQGEVSSNYYITEVAVEITNKNGDVIYSQKWFPNLKTVWLEDLKYSPKLYNYANGTYHFKLTASIPTGSKTIADYDFKIEY